MNDYICKCKSGYEGNGMRSKFVKLDLIWWLIKLFLINENLFRCFLDESYGLHLIYAQGSSLHKVPFKQSDSDNASPHKNRIVFIPGIRKKNAHFAS
jgi:hypothetical protein